MLDAWGIAATVVYASLVVINRASACVEVNATTLTGDMFSHTRIWFSCSTSEFVTGVDIIEDLDYGEIAGIRWMCSEGMYSDWVGRISDPTDTSQEARALSFKAGLNSIKSSFSVEYDVTASTSSITTSNSLEYIGMMYVSGYSPDSASPVIYGPFGSLVTTVYTSTSTNTSCAAGSLATGANVWASLFYVTAIQLECAEVTSTCVFPESATTPAPTSTIANTPAPDTADSTVNSTPTPTGTTSTGDNDGGNSSPLGLIIGGSAATGFLFGAIIALWYYCVYRKHLTKSSPGPEAPNVQARVQPPLTVQTVPVYSEGTHPAAGSVGGHGPQPGGNMVARARAPPPPYSAVVG